MGGSADIISFGSMYAKPPNLVDDGSKFTSDSGCRARHPRRKKEIRTKEELPHALALTFDILDLFPFNFNMLRVGGGERVSVQCASAKAVRVLGLVPWGRLSVS